MKEPTISTEWKCAKCGFKSDRFEREKKDGQILVICPRCENVVRRYDMMGAY